MTSTPTLKLPKLSDFGFVRTAGDEPLYLDPFGRFSLRRERYRVAQLGHGRTRWATGWVMTDHVTGRAIGPAHYWSSRERALGALAKHFSRTA